MFKKTIRILSWGGVGDVMLSTPAVAALKKKYPSSRIIVYSHSWLHGEVFINNPHVHRFKVVSRWMYIVLVLLNRYRITRMYDPKYKSVYPSLFYNKNVIEIIAELYNVTLTDKKIQIYLSREEEAKAKEMLAPYENPVIIHVHSRSCKNEEWFADKWEELVRITPGCTFIQLGLMDEVSIKGAVDMRGTSFREALALVKHSRSFIGVNSSFSHATNAFDIPGVVLFGASNPEIWGHDVNINLYKRVRCAPCLEWLYGRRCPYGRHCMTSISAEEVKHALLQQMERCTVNNIPNNFNRSLC